MKIMALSGWGQPYDALRSIVPDATHVDYGHFSDVGEALAHIAEAGKTHDVAIGWSLGGQLLVRAIAAGMIHPRALVLISAPFQFVQTPEKPIGMKRDLYEKFRENYAKNPVRTLHKAWELVTLGDANAEPIRELMAGHDKDPVMQRNWLYWLHALDGFSVDELHLADFPPTLLVHGKNDAVVEHAQQAHFARKIPHGRVLTLEEAGHAPHWHDGEKIRGWIADHV
ncbi:MAG: alpha/beta fold hydrolase [Alphaproteobacteria bacterium]|nr:alpha/beta fold hydrolase [Alphaproteobacteria bacterium]